MNQQYEQTKTHRQTMVWWLPEGKRCGDNKEEGGQIYGDGRRFDFGWWAQMQYTGDET